MADSVVAADPVDPSMKVDLKIFADVDLTAESAGETANFMVRLEPPQGSLRQPSDISVVLDISGSMGMEATIQNASGVTESHGLTLLDVAKHGVRTVVETLGENDNLALIAFNHGASEIFPLTKMDEAGRKFAMEKIDSFGSGGQTDIWLGLSSGLDALEAATTPGRFGHIMLLTDGESCQKETIVSRLATRVADSKSGRLGYTINTFGFGYNLDSQLLVDLANAGSGSYNFIPDAGFVGTAFVNLMSQLLVTMAHEVVLLLEKPEAGAGIEIDGVMGGLELISDLGSDGLKVKLGTLQYGQSKDVVVKVKTTGPPSDAPVAGGYAADAGGSEQPPEALVGRPEAGRKALGAKLVYEVPTGKLESSLVQATTNGAASAEAAAANVVTEQVCRCSFVETILECVREAVVGSTAIQPCLEKMEACAAKIKASQEANAPDSQFITDLLEDVNGQSTQALSKPEWYTKWGRHYLPSIMFAHSLQVCNNFKDPGIQHYGGTLFEEVRDKADDAFNSLPAPTPSRRVSVRSGGAAAAPVSMAAYNDRCSG